MLAYFQRNLSAFFFFQMALRQFRHALAKHSDCLLSFTVGMGFFGSAATIVYCSNCYWPTKSQLNGESFNFRRFEFRMRAIMACLSTDDKHVRTLIHLN